MRQLLLIGKNVIESEFDRGDCLEFAATSTTMARSIAQLLQAVEAVFTPAQAPALSEKPVDINNNNNRKRQLSIKDQDQHQINSRSTPDQQ